MPESPETSNPAVVELLRLARAGQYDALESAWMEAVEAGAARAADLDSVVQAVGRGAEPKRKESLLWFMLTVLAEHAGPAEAIAAARGAADRFPESATLRDEVATLYAAAHPDRPDARALAAMTVLDPDLPLPEGLARMEQFLSLVPGTYVLDRRRMAPGCVRGADADRKALLVAFEDRERPYDVRTVDHLDVLEADDIRAEAIFARPQMEALAEEDPAALVRLVLKAWGPQLKFRDLKERIAPVVPPEAWAKWWAKAKAAVRRSPALEVSDGTQPTFTLRFRPVAYEDAAISRFDAAAGEERLLAAVAYLAEAGEGAAHEGVLRHLAEALAAQADAAAEADPAAALGALAVLADIRRRAPQVVPAAARPIASVLGPGTDAAAILASVRSSDLALRILDAVREAMPDRWHEVYAAAMPGCAADVCDRMAADLAAGGRAAELAAAVDAALQKPERAAGALVWLWKAFGAGRCPEALAQVDRVAVAFGLLKAATWLGRERTEEAKALLAQVRSALAAKTFGLLREVLPAASPARMKDIRHAVDRTAGLSEHARVAILEIIHSAHPTLFAKPPLAPWEDEAVIYTTEASLKKHRKAFEHLANVTMTENARAIGAAAAHGDLTENAEFTAAMEERDRLAAKAGQMRDDLAKARVITGAMAASPSVTVGSAVQARSTATGEARQFVFLGPWDADLERGIYSYRAALALAFMGKEPGDTVVLRADSEETPWEILSVESGLSFVQEEGD